MRLKFIVAVNGTGADRVILSAPTEINALTIPPVFFGYHIGTNKAIVGSVENNFNIWFRYYDGTYPLGDGQGMFCNGTYESVD